MFQIFLLLFTLCEKLKMSEDINIIKLKNYNTNIAPLMKNNKPLS